MDFVVYLALGVLFVVFVVSLIILIAMCRRRAIQLKYLNFSPSSQNQRFSKLQNLESIEGIAQLSPMIAASLDKNSWVYDVSGLLQHCVALLRLCHSLSDKLSRIPLQASIRQHPPLNTVLCEATHRVLPAFDDLLHSVASPNVDVRVLEARATSLATICWGLCLPFVLINPKVHEAIGNPLGEMDTHLIILRQAAEMAEKAEMGKLQMDWNALAEEDNAETAEEGEETETKIETTPLVDKNATTSDSKEEKR